jgi:hypothetical protein
MNNLDTIKKIVIEVIPHDTQRYPTIGDYYFSDSQTLQIKVSKLSCSRHELLVMVHELVEVMLTEHDNVLESEISGFDINFEDNRLVGNLDEPGDHPDAPYKRQHCIATSVERMMCALLGVDWQAYENDCNSK